MNTRFWQVISIVTTIIVLLLIVTAFVVGSNFAVASPTATSEEFGTDVEIGQLYELDQPVGVSFKETAAGPRYEVRFGGSDRNRRPQYLFLDNLVITDQLPLGTARWVSETSYRETDGIVYDSSNSVRVKVFANPRPGQAVTNRSFRGGQPRSRR